MDFPWGKGYLLCPSYGYCGRSAYSYPRLRIPPGQVHATQVDGRCAPHLIPLHPYKTPFVLILSFLRCTQSALWKCSSGSKKVNFKCCTSYVPPPTWALKATVACKSQDADSQDWYQYILSRASEGGSPINPP